MLQNKLDHLPQFRLGHRPELDGLRGISILLVLYVHGSLFYYGRGGFLGVDIFFVLSGFLITSLLCQEWEETGTISFKRFYTRRALRLLPALLVLLLVNGILTLLFPPESGIWPVFKHLLAVLFYVSNWVQGNNILPHTWSLGIEEQFYIVWPIVFLFVLQLKFSRKTILLTLLGLIIALVIYRALFYYINFSHMGPAHSDRMHIGTDTRCDTLFVGCFAALLVSWQMIPRKPMANAIIRFLLVASYIFLAVMIILLPARWDHLYYGVFTLVAIAAAIVVTGMMVFQDSLFNRILRLPLLTWFGKLSYSLYLWHVTVYSWYGEIFSPFQFNSYTLNLLLPFAIKISVSILLASISYYYVEKPFLNIKRKFVSIESKERSEESQAIRMDLAKAAGVGT